MENLSTNKAAIAVVLHQMQELLDMGKQELISSHEYVDRHLPLVMKLDALRDQQFDELQRRYKEIEAMYKSNDDDKWELESRLMELEAMPLTDNMAVQFIIKHGLTDNFHRFVEDKLDTAFEEFAKDHDRKWSISKTKIFFIRIKRRILKFFTYKKKHS
jgi:hypothetical protein